MLCSNRITRYLTLAAMMIVLSISQISHAHGLHMSTAEIVARHSQHLTIRIHTSLPVLFSHMEYTGKPPSLIHLANGSDQQLAEFRQQLLVLFQEKMWISVGQKPLKSVKVRTYRTQVLKQKMQDLLAEAVLGQAGGHEDEQYESLRVDMDGFIDTAAENQQLQIHFPEQLGEIMVTYSKPQTQTLQPGQGKDYIQAM